ncbi:MAG: hypothetical protein H6729_00925 [Deltaproteobacteria bacterium]|nr:hypothetical protein [Deltaproteobacteria bacterium]
MCVDLTGSDIRHLFELLDKKLERRGVTGELHVVGGAVMCIVLNARTSTRDVDALFAPTNALREAAAEVATELDLPSGWLNDSVKGFFSANSDFETYLELDHLKVYAASPKYLLAMKALSMRIGEEFQDENDVRFLLRHLNIESYDEAVSIVTKYYELERLPQKTLCALQEMLPSPDPD